MVDNLILYKLILKLTHLSVSKKYKQKLNNLEFWKLQKKDNQSCNIFEIISQIIIIRKYFRQKTKFTTVKATAKGQLDRVS